MIYQFGPFELDLATVELRANGEVRDIEPQVFAVLALLIENHARLVSKDELIERVWHGRVVSDAAVASRVKSARQAIGDDGQSQRFIKTIHRHGFRFVAPVSAARSADSGTPDHRPERDSRPSIAVLPFRAVGHCEGHEALASALPDELIAELARLRWLFVTARGSSFRIRAENLNVGEVGRLLDVRYCLCGTVEVSGRRLGVTVDLIDTQDDGIVWAERFSGRIEDVHSIRDEIRTGVLAALELRIPMHEAALARLTVPENLSAWSAYHLGLQHLYRFNRLDNAAAARLLEHAVSLDPRFARAQAGLSFVHFQTAFMRYTADVTGESQRARQFAERALELDPLDPFVNFTMGRSYWLEGDLDSSLGWLERATSLSPNYAQGLYAQAWTEVLAGHGPGARTHVDLAMRLSPIDPLGYAMMATRAFTHMVVGEDNEAAHWAERGARAPGAHILILMIAAVAHTLNGNRERGEYWAAGVRERDPAINRVDFMRAFPMKPEAARARLSHALVQLGF